MKKFLLFIFALFFSVWTMGQTMSNYAFTTGTSGTLIDMSSGTTTIVPSSDDDTPGGIVDIGFTFVFMGTPYTQFSASPDGFIRLGPVAAVSQFSNSLTSTTNVPLIAPYWDDVATGTNGYVKYKTIGSSPNRQCVIEWFVTVPRNTTGAANTIFQLILNETSGVVDFIYGTIAAGSSYSIGMNTSATQFASVTVSTSTCSYVAANNSNANAITAGTQYTFTPPSVPPADPAWAAIPFTDITALAMTLNWDDLSSDETGFAVFRSDDGGTTYILKAITAPDINFYAASGLLPGTTYFWQVAALKEGNISALITNSQATNASSVITSAGTGGLWNDPGTWDGGVVPTAGDNVIIADGTTVTIDVTTATCWDLTIGQGASGILDYLAGTASTLTVNNGVTVSANGTFNSGTGALLTHALLIGGNINTGGGTGSLINEGVFDMYGPAGVTVTFFGIPDASISGTGPTLDFYRIILNKGTVTATPTVTPPVLEIQRAFTVQGANTAGLIFTHTAGVLKIGGSFTLSTPLYTTASYSIPALGGIWLDNANFTAAGQNGSPTARGLFRVTAGTYNIGTASGNSLGSGTNSVYIIEGGAINVTGRFNLTSTGVYYNQSGGILSVATVGNASSATASFGITSSTGTSFITSGGTIVLVQRATGATIRDYYVVAAPIITGGTLQVGSAATATNFNFRLYGYAPDIVIDNTTNNKKVEVYQLSGVLYIFGTLTVNPGTTFDCLGFTTQALGNVVNNGIIQGLIAGSRFDFVGTNPQTYSGSGTFGTAVAPFIGTGVGVANSSNVTLDSPIITTRVNLFRGTFINSNNITLGIGGTSGVFIQRGGGGTDAGSFDVAPTFNLGSGGISVLYYTATSATATGFEIPPTRTLTNMTINNAPGAILSGGDLTLGSTSAAGLLTLTLGVLQTGANTLFLPFTGTSVSGGSATSFVDGKLSRTFAASLNATGTYTAATFFPIGKGSTYMPLYIDPTTTADGSVTFSGEAFLTNSGTPGPGVGTRSDHRWEALITDGIANFTSAFFRLGDDGIIDGNQILQANAPDGSYNLITPATTFAAGSPNTLTATGTQLISAEYTGYFAYGALMPEITSLSLTSGCVGSSLTINGNYLGGATSVTIGGTPAVITGNTATVVTVTVGTGTTGTVDVTTGGGTATSAETFTVLQLPLVNTVGGGGAYCSGTSGVSITLDGSETGVDYSLSTTPVTTMPGTGDPLVFGPSPFDAGVYTITATNVTTGCTSLMTGDATVVVNPTPSTLIITPASATLPSDAIQQLDVTGGMIGGSGTAAIGNDVTLTGATTQPTAFCNRWRQYWCQMVFTAAELQAAGLIAGNITSITFNISTLGDASNVTNFRIHLGPVGTSTLSGFTTSGLTQVYGPSTYSHAIGTNLITFTNPYAWDGVSNILVDLRQDGADMINNARTYYTATAGNTVVTAITSSASPDLSTTNPSASTSIQRLNIVFGYNSSVQADITWSPIDDLYTDAGATIAYTGAGTEPTIWTKPVTTRLYTATATTLAGCSNSETVLVTSCPAVPGSPAASYISPTSFNLSWTFTGGNQPVSYTIDVATDNLFTNPIANSPFTVLYPDLSTTISGLTESTQYFYRISANVTGCTSDFTTPGSITTLCPPTVAPFNEGFEGVTFPPDCWTNTAVSGSFVWARSTAASGNGTGTASAIANFFDQNAGTYELGTMPIDLNGLYAPLLKFNFAYATYVVEIDEMDVYYSMDYGTSWILLLNMPGGPGGILNTGGTTLDYFIPNASQWDSVSVSLPAGTNMLKFTAISAYGNNLYLDDIRITSPVAINTTVENVTIPNGVSECYNASNIITVAGTPDTFLVEAGGSATFIAGQKISFLAGTTILPGGYLWGYIAPAGPFCGGKAVTIPSVTTGKEELLVSYELDNLTLYPNPTSGNFTLVQKSTNPGVSVNIEVYNMRGVKVMTGHMIGEKRHEFSITDMPDGLYFIKVVAGDYMETIKLVKTR